MILSSPFRMSHQLRSHQYPRRAKSLQHWRTQHPQLKRRPSYQLQLNSQQHRLLNVACNFLPLSLSLSQLRRQRFLCTMRAVQESFQTHPVNRRQIIKKRRNLRAGKQRLLNVAKPSPSKTKLPEHRSVSCQGSSLGTRKRIRTTCSRHRAFFQMEYGFSRRSMPHSSNHTGRRNACLSWSAISFASLRPVATT